MGRNWTCISLHANLHLYRLPIVWPPKVVELCELIITNRRIVSMRNPALTLELDGQRQKHWNYERYSTVFIMHLYKVVCNVYAKHLKATSKRWSSNCLNLVLFQSGQATPGTRFGNDIASDRCTTREAIWNPHIISYQYRFGFKICTPAKSLTPPSTNHRFEGCLNRLKVIAS